MQDWVAKWVFEMQKSRGWGTLSTYYKYSDAQWLSNEYGIAHLQMWSVLMLLSGLYLGRFNVCCLVVLKDSFFCYFFSSRNVNKQMVFCMYTGAHVHRRFVINKKEKAFCYVVFSVYAYVLLTLFCIVGFFFGYNNLV